MGNACGKAPLKGFGMITISDDVINMGLRGYDGESYYTWGSFVGLVHSRSQSNLDAVFCQFILRLC